ncbi:DNA-binding NarL/FixJ family response regulator [Hoeflea marina]|uniref:DNA-binding NarL/FixJ family response regulator n=1 Tax=Hoeflea marina TaxID=274592 RepID=A0A317PVF9_9HYPH|nr:LuxR C-terminal-related transcriptional regulator [Hoeflea marina]PWW03410.1 DNA-binding NarL/FixJ family response regulator [Hoeflea marina]
MPPIKPAITPATLDKWQRVVNLIAELADVPATLIMNTLGRDHSVFVASDGEDNPYEPGRTFRLHEKLYCFGVLEQDGELTVEDAGCDPRWADNEDMEHAMSFYVGLPLKWPDGEIFGTICVLDRRRNRRALMFRRGLREFARVVEDDLALLMEVDTRKSAEARLKQALENTEREVAARTNELQEANTALKVLIRNIEQAKAESEAAVMARIKTLVLPHVSKLRLLEADREPQASYIDLIDTGLRSITRALSTPMAETLDRLTPTEVEIVQMVLLGRSTKEIARTLSRGESTVDFHRNNIRRKLGLNDRAQNLRRHLASLAQ